jgi:hypothetical protein
MEPHAAMLNNLGVFMAADKFGILSLKVLASSRISDWIDKNAKKFPLTVQEIWSTIPPLETDLREAMIKSISCDAQEFLTYDESMLLFTDFPDITIAVLRKIVKEIYLLKLQVQRRKVLGRY